MILVGHEEIVAFTVEDYRRLLEYFEKHACPKPIEGTDIPAEQPRPAAENSVNSDPTLAKFYERQKKL